MNDLGYILFAMSFWLLGYIMAYYIMNKTGGKDVRNNKGQ